MSKDPLDKPVTPETTSNQEPGGGIGGGSRNVPGYDHIDNGIDEPKETA
jgi:hypothetical protein